MTAPSATSPTIWIPVRPIGLWPGPTVIWRRVIARAPARIATAPRKRARAAEDRQRAAHDRDAAAFLAEALEHEVEGLRYALDTRLQIGQAEGLLMARYGLDADAAFRLLIKLSQETHMKLREVAARLVAEAAGESSAPRGDIGE